VSVYTVEPEQFGMAKADVAALAVDSAETSLAMVKSVLDNQPGPARDIVVLNAGAAIYTAGLADSLEEGVKKADEAIASGAARAKLDQLVEVSNSFK
jgi:anthranilate phosphoribosyltransferase